MNQHRRLRDILERQARASRRAMVESGELITESEFRRRLGRRAVNLEKELQAEQVFRVEVEHAMYFPALLVRLVKVDGLPIA